MSFKEKEEAMFLSLLVTFGVDHRSTSSIMREKETKGKMKDRFPK